MAVQDVVIPVRGGHRNEELRYALRAIEANVPHRHVWLVGHRPPWVAPEVRHIPTVQARRQKWANTRLNRSAACAHPEVSERFLLFNDDFFVCKPLRFMPVFHRGPVEALVERQAARIGGRRNAYIDGARATAQWLRDEYGIAAPLSYEVHAPMPVEKRKLAAVLALAEESGLALPHIRTLYGNLNQLGGIPVVDVKVSDLTSVPRPGEVFVSTTGASFREGAVGRWLRALLPDPCRFENEEVAA